MRYKYLEGGIFAPLHRERNACSSNEIFLESLNELKEVFNRNSYPPWLVKDKIIAFLKYDKKPDRPETTMSICCDYTSRNIEQYIYN